MSCLLCEKKSDSFVCTENLNYVDAYLTKIQYDQDLSIDKNQITNKYHIIPQPRFFMYMPYFIKKIYVRHQLSQLMSVFPGINTDWKNRFDDICDISKQIIRGNFSSLTNINRHVICFDYFSYYMTTPQYYNPYTYCLPNLNVLQINDTIENITKLKNFSKTQKVKIVDLGIASIFYPNVLQIWLFKKKYYSDYNIIIREKYQSRFI